MTNKQKAAINAVTVKMPATIANLGSGFDCVGVAVNLWDALTVTRGEFGVAVNGPDAELIPNDSSNLFVGGVQAVFKEVGAKVPPLRYELRQQIPVGRGLGSSSAAIVAGLLAGNALMGGTVSERTLLKLAADIEGHPDNVAPALLGGFVVGVRDESDWITMPVSVANDLNCVVFRPETVVETAHARSELPDSIGRDDAIYNIGRAALLVGALSSGKYDLLKYAVQDRLHQPYRKTNIAGYDQIAKGAMEGGAHAVFIAGSGPTIAAFASDRQVTISYEMQEAARKMGVDGKTMVLTVCGGAYIECTQ